MSLVRPAVRPLARAPIPSSSRSASYQRPVNQWPGKSHVRKAPTVPNPLPALYAQKVVLSDGSTFTSYSTAPVPMINRLTRDVTNNPLWQPGSERRGLGDSGVEEGRVGRFRRMFEGTDAAAAAPTADGAAAPASGSQFAEADLSWMSEGAKEETLSDKQRQGPQKKKGKGKK